MTPSSAFFVYNEPGPAQGTGYSPRSGGVSVMDTKFRNISLKKIEKFPPNFVSTQL
jgi:hypothetical protein